MGLPIPPLLTHFNVVDLNHHFHTSYQTKSGFRETIRDCTQLTLSTVQCLKTVFTSKHFLAFVSRPFWYWPFSYILTVLSLFKLFYNVPSFTHRSRTNFSIWTMIFFVSRNIMDKMFYRPKLAGAVQSGTFSGEVRIICTLLDLKLYKILKQMRRY